MAPTRHAPRRPGTTLAWVVLSLSVLVGMMALALDGGRLVDERRRLQVVADAAALAAGKELYAGYWANLGTDPSGAARTSALQSAAANGYPASAVTVNIPPASGPLAGRPGHAEVNLSSTVEAGFGRIFTGGGMPVTARSVGRGEPMKIGIIALRPTGADAVLNNSAALAVLNKPIIVNSNHPAAFHQASFGAAVASRIDVTGGYSNTGGALTLARIRTKLRPVLDPLMFLPVPSSATVRSTKPLTIDPLLPLPVSLQPGVYQGGIRIAGAAVVTMAPGVYVMEGGGFRVEELASVVGLETMVYNTTSPAYAGGPISIQGLGKVVMTAPSSGVYQGIGFFQHRGMTEPFEIAGLGLKVVTGTVYAASAPATLSGSASALVDVRGGAYVVNSLTAGGVGTVAVNLDLSLTVGVDLGIAAVSVVLKPNRPRVPDVRVVE